jgi:hypothetical protein
VFSAVFTHNVGIPYKDVIQKSALKRNKKPETHAIGKERKGKGREGDDENGKG